MNEKILIIDDDLDTLRLVGLMLQRQGYQISAATNGPQGLVRAEEEVPDLIVLDVMMPEMDGYEVARRLRKNPVTAEIPILMFTAKTQLDDKVTGFESGADDYLTKPTHPSELQAHVRALLGRTRKKTKTTAPAAALEQHGHVIGIFSARSGLGVSTIAANLAASLMTNAKADVILAEMCPGQGTLGLELGHPNPQELTRLLTADATLLSRTQVQDALWTHPSGLRCLLASEQPRDVNLVSAIAQFEAITRRLSTLAQYVVLDLGAGLFTSVQKMLDLCHERILVVEGFPNPINHAKTLLTNLAEIGIDGKKVMVVLNNRLRSETQLAWNQTQELLGHSVSLMITPAPELFYQAARLQTFAVLYQPESLTAQQFAKLTTLIAKQTRES
ncbi:MAG: response regulator [Candidatus Villigracilaceae bacterium]